MPFLKENISEIKALGNARELVIRLTYIKSDECDFVSSYNRAIAEKIHGFATSVLPEHLPSEGSVVVLLTPTIAFAYDGILSVKYDFTVSSQSILLFHKRFGINMLTDKKILLLPRFISGRVRKRDAFSYYLLREGEKTLYVPIEKSLSAGARLPRARDIDEHCNGKMREVKIKIPPCLKAGRINVSIKKKKARSHSSKP